MKAVILVGGEGTRLRPLTLSSPKPLMPVAGRPFLDHVLTNLAGGGVTEAIVATRYMAQAFETLPAVEGIRVTLIEEDKPLGSAGAVANVRERLTGDFLVCNADILC